MWISHFLWDYNNNNKYNGNIWTENDLKHQAKRHSVETGHSSDQRRRLGFRRVSMLASSAYIASAASTRPLVSAVLDTVEWSDVHLDEILESRSSTKPTGDEQLLTSQKGMGQTFHSHREGCSVVVQQRPTQPGKACCGVIATLWGLAPHNSSGLVRVGPEQWGRAGSSWTPTRTLCPTPMPLRWDGRFRRPPRAGL